MNSEEVPRLTGFLRRYGKVSKKQDPALEDEALKRDERNLAKRRKAVNNNE